MPIPAIPGVPRLLSRVDPGYDGHKQWYLDPSQREANVSRHCLYINGILTSPSAHRATAESLSNIGPNLVLGVYNESNVPGARSFVRYLRRIAAEPVVRPNRTMGMPTLSDPLRPLSDFAGFVSDEVRARTEEMKRTLAGYLANVVEAASGPVDFLQCLKDVMLIGSAGAGAGVSSMARMGLPAAWLLDPLLNRVLLLLIVGYMQADNRAAHSMYQLISRYPSSLGKLIIVSHSQGNLCTALALWAYRLAQRIASQRMNPRIHVFALAPPVPTWPSEPHVYAYYHVNDLVAWIGAAGTVLTADERHPASSGVGFVDTHDVGLHMKRDDFKVRFRQILNS